MDLITKSFAAQAVAFPDRVETMLAKVATIKGRKDMLDKAAAMQHYAERLKAGIEIEKPIALGVLRIKAGIGELLPDNRSVPAADRLADRQFNKNTVAAFRKLADNRERLGEYMAELDAGKRACEDVPTQAGFLKFCNGAHVGNNSGENEWYTSAEYIDAARAVMGSIDLDPASCAVANEAIGATMFFDEDADGASVEWGGNVWLNPPYSQPTIGRFAEKVAAKEYATETKWFQLMASVASAFCFPAGRVKFWHPDRKSASPLQGQAVIYVGPSVASFVKRFAEFGVCRKFGDDQ